MKKEVNRPRLREDIRGFAIVLPTVLASVMSLVGGTLLLVGIAITADPPARDAAVSANSIAKWSDVETLPAATITEVARFSEDNTIFSSGTVTFSGKTAYRTIDYVFNTVSVFDFKPNATFVTVAAGHDNVNIENLAPGDEGQTVEIYNVGRYPFFIRRPGRVTVNPGESVRLFFLPRTKRWVALGVH